MRKIKALVRRHPRLSYGLYVIGVLVLGALVFLAIINSRLPGTVWLPGSAWYETDADILFALPVKSETVLTSYGKAVRYSSTIGWSTEYKETEPTTVIYAFRANPRLKATDCPNIMGIEPVSPQGCKKTGTFQGSPVYEMNRRLGSEATVAFVRVDDTFIYVNRGGAEYIRTFVSFPRGGTKAYLAANDAAAERVKAAQKTKKAAIDKAKSLSYTHLDFNPALATAVPQGWSLDDSSKYVSVDGPDPEHPKLVTTTYSSKDDKQSVRWYSGKLSDFVVMGSCGPTPTAGMGYLACDKVPGKDMYVTESYDDRNNYSRYTYAPVGSSMVITGITVLADGRGQPPRPTGLIAAQDLIAQSAKQVDKNSLKGSRFFSSFYYVPPPVSGDEIY